MSTPTTTLILPKAVAHFEVPEPLKQRAQWVVWRAEKRDGVLTKVPYQARHLSEHARATSPETWATYDEAVGKLTLGNDSPLVTHIDGLGFVTTADDPFTLIDLDGCVDDGEVVTEAQAIVDSLPGYWEVSPSGSGLHGFVYGSLPVDAGNRGAAVWADGKPHVGVEAYDCGRFFTITGTGRGEISECQDALDEFAAKYLGKREPSTYIKFDWDAEPAPGEGFDGTDDELIEYLCGDDPRFASLWAGDMSRYDDDHSKADFALCCQIAELAGNHPRRVLRIWGMSELANREKFERVGYQRSTVARAIAKKLEAEAATIGGARENASTKDFTVSFSRSQGVIEEGLVGVETPSANSPAPVETESSDVAPLPAWKAKLAGSTIGQSARALRDSPRGKTDWIVPGVAARGWAVIFAGREKIAGKGTLISYLISRLERGEATVFGAAAKTPITALILTEEPWDSLAEKQDSFDIEKAQVVFLHELGSLTWEEKTDYLIATALEQGHGIIYVDNISAATGVNTEGEIGLELARAIKPLSNAAKKHNITVFLDHHNRKSGGKVEDLLRGGTALPGAVENIIAIDRDGDWITRRRRLHSRGRVKSTLWERVIELSEDGTEYTEARGDYRLRILAGRREWTVKDFAVALGKTEPTARAYLNDSPHVERVEPQASGGVGGGSKATLYRLTDRTALLRELDPDQEPAL